MRKLSLASALMAAAVVAFLGLPSQGFAATVVNVSLWDKGADKELPTDLGMGMPGNMNMAPVGITATPDDIKAGTVTFNVTNNSKDLIHEMLLVPLPDGTTTLPYNPDELGIDEEASNDIGEVSELDPGASGSLTVDLKPGRYALLCNVPAHYMAGMWEVFTVTQ